MQVRRKTIEGQNVLFIYKSQLIALTQIVFLITFTFAKTLPYTNQI